MQIHLRYILLSVTAPLLVMMVIFRLTLFTVTRNAVHFIHERCAIGSLSDCLRGFFLLLIFIFIKERIKLFNGTDIRKMQKGVLAHANIDKCSTNSRHYFGNLAKVNVANIACFTGCFYKQFGGFAILKNGNTVFVCS